MKRKLTIPASFELGGRTWAVSFQATPPIVSSHTLGNSIYDLQQINVYGETHGHAVSHETNEISFVHEVVHSLLDEIGYPQLSQDEIFVERLAKVAHQVLVTATGIAKTPS